MVVQVVVALAVAVVQVAVALAVAVVQVVLAVVLLSHRFSQGFMVVVADKQVGDSGMRNINSVKHKLLTHLQLCSKEVKKPEPDQKQEQG